MILDKRVIVSPGGATWRLSQDTVYNASNNQRVWQGLRTLSNGRIIAGDISGATFYSDNNGESWTQTMPGSLDSESSYFDIFELPNGRVFIRNTLGAFYSDNHGGTWIQWNSSTVTSASDICVTSTGRIFVCESRDIYYTDNIGGTWQNPKSIYSDNFVRFIITSTGKIITYTSNGGIYYSDDNGSTWTYDNDHSYNWTAYCVTKTGRLIIAHSDGISYTDDNGQTWSYVSITSGTISVLYATTSGRIFAGFSSIWTGSTNGIWYSDDDGETWTQLQGEGTSYGVLAICETLMNRIIIGSAYYGIRYSDPVVNIVPQGAKYLDQFGADELITQFKAYVDSLV